MEVPAMANKLFDIARSGCPLLSGGREDKAVHRGLHHSGTLMSEGQMCAWTRARPGGGTGLKCGERVTRRHYIDLGQTQGGRGPPPSRRRRRLSIRVGIPTLEIQKHCSAAQIEHDSPLL